MQILIDIFSKLVSFDSVSYEEDQIALFLETALLQAGLHTEYDEGRICMASFQGRERLSYSMPIWILSI
nr:hypothetical protein [uncultured Sphaerochaeta sp.]